MKKLFSVSLVFFVFLLCCTACSNNGIPENVMTPERERSTKVIEESLSVTPDRALEISRLFQIVGAPEIISAEILSADEAVYLARFVDVNNDGYTIWFKSDDTGSFNIWSEKEEDYIFTIRR